MMMISRDDLHKLCEAVLDRYFFRPVFNSLTPADDVDRCMELLAPDKSSSHLDAVSARNIITQCMSYVAKQNGLPQPPDRLIDVLEEDFNKCLDGGTVAKKFADA